MTMFSALSNLLYLVSVTPIASTVVIVMTSLLLCWAFRGLRKVRLAHAVLLTGVFGALWAAFLGQLTNVAFLNGFGVRAVAVVTERTSSRRGFLQGAERAAPPLSLQNSALRCRTDNIRLMPDFPTTFLRFGR